MNKLRTTYRKSRILDLIGSVVLLALVALTIFKPVNSLLLVVSGDSIELSVLDEKQNENETEDSEENQEVDSEEEKLKEDFQTIYIDETSMFIDKNKLSFNVNHSCDYTIGVTTPPPENTMS